ncbi:MAG: AAA family ATPase, partial [Cyclobacteriaceae bacterium]
MLTHLKIKNYALINHLEMDLSDHLNVITGETGAGKSIMLGALGLLLGNRADTKVLWDPNEKCITEGTFNIQPYNLQSVFEQEDLDYDPQTVLRREINAAGKSRAFVNDTPVNLDVMKRVGSLLMDIHSQHETLNLATREFQLRLIDSFAGNHKIRQSYLEAWKTYEQQKGDYEKLQNEAASLKQESDFVNFQLKELSDANLEEGEQARLEEDLRIMEHAEDIKTKFNSILSQLDQSEMSTTAQLSEVRSMLSSLSNYSENYRALYTRFDSLRIELGDIINEIEKEDQKIDFDPRKIEET